MFNILVIEDDKNLKKLITTCLIKNNYNVFQASNGIEALEVLDKEYINAIITDIMMPIMDGYELIKELRESNYNMPILVLTAKGTLEDKKQAFNLGIDDYMVKPIDINELPLRIKALLRRCNDTNEKVLKIGDLILNYNQLSTIYGDKKYYLTQKEFYLLYKLLSKPDYIFTRQELIEEIWGMENESEYRTIDVHIKRIREKMKDVNEFEIKSIRGLGYKAILK